MQVSNPTHVIVASNEKEDELEEVEAEDVEERNKWFEVMGEDVWMFNVSNPASIGVVDSAEDIEAPCPSKKSDTGNMKVKVQFGRQQTHNEQTLVRPCGIIFARATM